jgi:hypothetical protein
MCFVSDPPKIKPDPLPMTPDQASFKADSDLQKKKALAIAPRSGTVITSATGDPNYGKSANVTRLVA